MIHSKRFSVAVVAMAVVLMVAGAAWSQKSDDQPGWLGVTIQDVTKDLRDALPRGTEDGVLISNVMKDSPAAEAGLEDGDVITGFNRETIRDTDDLTRAVRKAGAGARVSIEFYRDGRRMRDRVTLGEQPGKLGWVDEDDDGNVQVWIDEDGARHELKDGKHKVMIREGKRGGLGAMVWEDEKGNRTKLNDGKRRIVIKRPKGGGDDEVTIWHDGEELHGLLEEHDLHGLLEEHGLKGMLEGHKGAMKFRAGGPGDMNFFVGDRPKLGVMLMDLGDQLADYFGAADGGALISEVMEDSPAEKAGLKAGDVIARVNGTAVEDAADVSKMLRKSDAGDLVKVEVMRKGRAASFDVEIEESDAEWYSAGPGSDRNVIIKRFGGDNDFEISTTPRAGKYEFFDQKDSQMDSELKEMKKELQELREELSKLKSRRP